MPDHPHQRQNNSSNHHATRSTADSEQIPRDINNESVHQGDNGQIVDNLPDSTGIHHSNSNFSSRNDVDALNGQTQSFLSEHPPSQPPVTTTRPSAPDPPGPTREAALRILQMVQPDMSFFDDDNNEISANVRQMPTSLPSSLLSHHHIFEFSRSDTAAQFSAILAHRGGRPVVVLQPHRATITTTAGVPERPSGVPPVASVRDMHAIAPTARATGLGARSPPADTLRRMQATLHQAFGGRGLPPVPIGAAAVAASTSGTAASIAAPHPAAAQAASQAVVPRHGTMASVHIPVPVPGRTAPPVTAPAASSDSTSVAPVSAPVSAPARSCPQAAHAPGSGTAAVTTPPDATTTTHAPTSAAIAIAAPANAPAVAAVRSSAHQGASATPASTAPRRMHPHALPLAALQRPRALILPPSALPAASLRGYLGMQHARAHFIAPCRPTVPPLSVTTHVPALSAQPFVAPRPPHPALPAQFAQLFALAHASDAVMRLTPATIRSGRGRRALDQHGLLPLGETYQLIDGLSVLATEHNHADLPADCAAAAAAAGLEVTSKPRMLRVNGAASGWLAKCDWEAQGLPLAAAPVAVCGCGAMQVCRAGAVPCTGFGDEAAVDDPCALAPEELDPALTRPSTRPLFSVAIPHLPPHPPHSHAQAPPAPERPPASTTTALAFAALPGRPVSEQPAPRQYRIDYQLFSPHPRECPHADVDCVCSRACSCAACLVEAAMVRGNVLLLHAKPHVVPSPMMPAWRCARCSPPGAPAPLPSLSVLSAPTLALATVPASLAGTERSLAWAERRPLQALFEAWYGNGNYFPPLGAALARERWGRTRAGGYAHDVADLEEGVTLTGRDWDWDHVQQHVQPTVANLDGLPHATSHADKPTLAVTATPSTACPARAAHRHACPVTVRAADGVGDWGMQLQVCACGANGGWGALAPTPHHRSEAVPHGDAQASAATATQLAGWGEVASVPALAEHYGYDGPWGPVFLTRADVAASKSPFAAAAYADAAKTSSSASSSSSSSSSSSTPGAIMRDAPTGPPSMPAARQPWVPEEAVRVPLARFVDRRNERSPSPEDPSRARSRSRRRVCGGQLKSGMKEKLLWSLVDLWTLGHSFTYGRPEAAVVGGWQLGSVAGDDYCEEAVWNSHAGRTDAQWLACAVAGGLYPGRRSEEESPLGEHGWAGVCAGRVVLRRREVYRGDGLGYGRVGVEVCEHSLTPFLDAQGSAVGSGHGSMVESDAARWAWDCGATGPWVQQRADTAAVCTTDATASAGAEAPMTDSERPAPTAAALTTTTTPTTATSAAGWPSTPLLPPAPSCHAASPLSVLGVDRVSRWLSAQPAEVRGTLPDYARLNAATDRLLGTCYSAPAAHDPSLSSPKETSGASATLSNPLLPAPLPRHPSQVLTDSIATALTAAPAYLHAASTRMQRVASATVPPPLLLAAKSPGHPLPARVNNDARAGYGLRSRDLIASAAARLRKCVCATCVSFNLPYSSTPVNSSSLLVLHPAPPPSLSAPLPITPFTPGVDWVLFFHLFSLAGRATWSGSLGSTVMRLCQEVAAAMALTDTAEEAANPARRRSGTTAAAAATAAPTRAVSPPPFTAASTAAPSVDPLGPATDELDLTPSSPADTPTETTAHTHTGDAAAAADAHPHGPVFHPGSLHHCRALLLLLLFPIFAEPAFVTGLAVVCKALLRCLHHPFSGPWLRSWLLYLPAAVALRALSTLQQCVYVHALEGAHAHKLGYVAALLDEMFALQRRRERMSPLRQDPRTWGRESVLALQRLAHDVVHSDAAEIARLDAGLTWNDRHSTPSALSPATSGEGATDSAAGGKRAHHEATSPQSKRARSAAVQAASNVVVALPVAAEGEELVLATRFTQPDEPPAEGADANAAVSINERPTEKEEEEDMSGVQSAASTEEDDPRSLARFHALVTAYRVHARRLLRGGLAARVQAHDWFATLRGLHECVPMKDLAVPTAGLASFDVDTQRFLTGSHSRFNWRRHVPVLDVPAKVAYMRSEARLAPVMSVPLPMLAFFAPPSFTVQVARNAPLEGLAAAVTLATRTQMRRELRVVVHGEEAVDAGGVRREMLQLAMSRLLSAGFGLFARAEDDAQLWFAADALQLGAAAAEDYANAGMLLGLAVFNSAPLQLPLPPMLHSLLLAHTISWGDVAALAPAALHAVEGLVTGASVSNGQVEGLPLLQPLAPLDLDWVHRTSLCGVQHAHPLAIDADAPVTFGNRLTYAALLARWLAGQGAAKALTFFARGFWRVCLWDATLELRQLEQQMRRQMAAAATRVLETARMGTPVAVGVGSALTPEAAAWRALRSRGSVCWESYLRMRGGAMAYLTGDELQRIASGRARVSTAWLRSHTAYQDGYAADTQAVQWLWECVAAMAEEERSAFVKFCTGSEAVPVQSDRQVFLTVVRAGADSERLPSAHTCFHVLLLPDYATKEKLVAKLRTAIANCEGFGLR